VSRPLAPGAAPRLRPAAPRPRGAGLELLRQVLWLLCAALAAAALLLSLMLLQQPRPLQLPLGARVAASQPTSAPVPSGKCQTKQAVFMC
jgi:hypothetical protein